MSYIKLVDYASKDALSASNPSKLVKGTELGAEFDAIAVADALNVKVSGNQTIAGIKTFSDITDAMSSTSAGTVVSGGLAIAKKANIGTNLTVGGTVQATGGVDNLTTATGVVSVASAIAPSIGQTLVATSSTAAEWKSISFASPGANSDITSLSGLTTPLSIVQGGTGGTTQAAALTAQGALLNGVIAKTSAYTVAAADRGKLIDATTGTWTLTQLSAVTAGDGFSYAVKNSGTGVITHGSDAFAAGESAFYVSDGAAWKSVAMSVQPVTVRQTVELGTVDSNGFAAFGGSTGSTTVTTATTLYLNAANGMVNRRGSITNPSWTGLSTNGTMYAYLDIAADGTCTTGSTTLAPVYQFGGTYSTTSNQFTFNIQEMTGKVGNGSTAAQTYRVFVGEVTVASGVVTAITWYALMGRYKKSAQALTIGMNVSMAHNIGTADVNGYLIVTDTGNSNARIYRSFTSSFDSLSRGIHLVSLLRNFANIAIHSSSDVVSGYFDSTSRSITASSPADIFLTRTW